MSEVVKSCSSSADCGGQFGTAKAFEGLDFEVFVESVLCGFEKVGVGIIGKGAWQRTELLELIVRNQ